MKSANFTPPPVENRRRSFTDPKRSPLPLLFLTLLLVAAPLLADAPAAVSQTTLVSNTRQIRGITNTIIDSFGSNRWNLAPGFTTGSNAGVYTLCAVDVKIKPTGSNATLQASICNTSPSDAKLSPNTTYAVVLEEASGGTASRHRISFPATANHIKDSGAASGWSIADKLHSQQNGGVWTEGNTNIIFIAIKGTASSQPPPPPHPPSPTVIESPEGVLHSGNANDGFSLAPLEGGGSMVYGQRTIDLSVAGDAGMSSGIWPVKPGKNRIRKTNQVYMRPHSEFTARLFYC